MAEPLVANTRLKGQLLNCEDDKLSWEVMGPIDLFSQHGSDHCDDRALAYL